MSQSVKRELVVRVQQATDSGLTLFYEVVNTSSPTKKAVGVKRRSSTNAPSTRRKVKTPPEKQTAVYA